MTVSSVRLVRQILAYRSQAIIFPKPIVILSFPVVCIGIYSSSGKPFLS